MTFDVKSGPHPHSQSNGGEVREVQFEVLRRCPVDNPKADLPIVGASFPVWLRYPSDGLDPSCGVPYYRQAAEQSDVWRLHGFTENLNGTVCEHMGRIIE